MKRLLTLHPAIIFSLTAALPIIGLLLAIVITLFTDPDGLLLSVTSENFVLSVFFISWFLGLIIHLLWATTAGRSLHRLESSASWRMWLTLLTGTIALTILLYVTWEISSFIFVPAIKASESVGGFSSIRSNADRVYAYFLVFGLWFLPRFLLYGLTAWGLIRVEKQNRFLSTFILFILWPIGIWFLQPRLRAIFGSPQERDIADHLV